MQEFWSEERGAWERHRAHGTRPGAAPQGFRDGAEVLWMSYGGLSPLRKERYGDDVEVQAISGRAPREERVAARLLCGTRGTGYLCDLLSWIIDVSQGAHVPDVNPASIKRG